MAYERCACHVGDIPHPTEATHKRQHSRCTRVATHRVRRRKDTSGRKCIGPWYSFCEPCAKACRAYQGSVVEVHEGLEER